MRCFATSCINVIWKRRPFCEEHWKGLRGQLQRRIHKWFGQRNAARYQLAVAEAIAEIDEQEDHIHEQ